MTMEYAAANILLNQARTDQDTGANIIFDVLYERLGGGWYADYDTFDQAAQSRITQGEVEWAELYVPMQISGTELKKNAGMTVSQVMSYKKLNEIPDRGKNTLVNILNSQIRHAKEDAKHLIAKGIYGDGSGNAGKQMDGFGNIIEASTSDYAGIAYTELTAIDKNSHFNDPNYPWQPKVDSNSGTNRALDWSAIMTMYQDCRIGSNKSDYVFVDGQMINAVISVALGENQKILEDARLAELGFEHVKIAGGPTFVVDDYCDEYNLWWINTKHMWIQMHPTAWDFSGWKVPTNQSALIAQLTIMLQLVCDDRGKMGFMDDYEP
jgi:hypothetical protein